MLLYHIAKNPLVMLLLLHFVHNILKWKIFVVVIKPIPNFI